VVHVVQPRPADHRVREADVPRVATEVSALESCLSQGVEEIRARGSDVVAEALVEASPALERLAGEEVGRLRLQAGLVQEGALEQLDVTTRLLIEPRPGGAARGGLRDRGKRVSGWTADLGHVDARATEPRAADRPVLLL
jgi:hypothetical protein